MKIKFLGAIGEVTGSCTWCITDSGAEFLVDCGSYQGWNADWKNQQPFLFNAEKIQFVLLTHAHIDHCGRIPLLYKRGFKGKVFCTSATKDLAELNLLDAAKIVTERAKSEGVPLLFTKNDVQRIQFSPIKEHDDGFRKPAPMNVENNFWVNFNRSSHMLGAASITVSWESGGRMRKICFSGDVGNNRESNSYQALLKRNQIPHKDVDYVVLESTYGSRPSRVLEHKDAVKRLDALKRIVCNPAYNLVIFPCFALQRTQEVLFDLFCALEYCNPSDSTKYRIVCDSPMAKKASSVFKRHLTMSNPADATKFIYLNDHCVQAVAKSCKQELDACKIASQIFDEDGHETEKLSVNGEYAEEFNLQEKLETVAPEEKIILITSSGMCQEGPISTHLSALTRDDMALVLTGYQSTDNGQLLQKLALGEPVEQSDAVLEIKDEQFNDRQLAVKDICGKVFNLGAYYSGHADADNLLKFLFERAGDKGHASSPKQVAVFLNHGDDGARFAFKKLIEDRSGKGGDTDMRTVGEVVIPNVDSRFYDLNEGEWVGELYEILQNQHRIMEKLDNLFAYIRFAGANKGGKKQKQEPKDSES